MSWQGGVVRSVVFFAACLMACITPDLVPCGDLQCPRGATCVADELCANAEQLTACEGTEDGGRCLLAGNAGRCDRGVCSPSGCGNNAMDVGEMCDDGNQTSGDGCRADCGKREQCGDAEVDYGEGCDDGNANAADGCDACVPTSWRPSVVLGGTEDATMVGLAYPRGLGVDRLGNLYVADSSNHRIRRVDPTGVMTTVAGSGAPGNAGDGGPATNASLQYPEGLAVDGLGAIYIADRSNHRIRRVDPSGVITTVAGSGAPGYAGDGGPATSARLSSPTAVIVDGLGGLYIADASNHRIRRVDPSGIITTVAGSGTPGYGGDGDLATAASLYMPTGLAIDGAGILYIADLFNHRIRRVDTEGVITTVAGTGIAGFAGDGGPATAARINHPQAVVVDGLGALYIPDRDNSRVRRVDPSGVITTVAGVGTQGFTGDGGPATSAQFRIVYGLALDGLGALYVSDLNNHRIRRIDPTGIISTVAGAGTLGFNGDGGAATSTQLGSPGAVTVDAAGTVYIASAHRVRRVDAMGVITTVAGTGAPGFAGDGGAATEALLRNPEGLALDGLGNLYIADAFNHRVRRVDPTGVITTVAGTGIGGFAGDGGPATSAQLSRPAGLVVDALGNLFIAELGGHRIRRVDATGVITTVVGDGTPGFAGAGGPAADAVIASPYDVAVDGLGNLYIADTENSRIRRVGIDGVIETIATVYYPYGVAIDGMGNVYMSDGSNHVVYRLDPAGEVMAVAGVEAMPGFSGDGGPATSAELHQPMAIDVGALGEVYIAEVRNGTVRRISATGTITTIAGAIDPEGTGPVATAHLADPRAVVASGAARWFAGGASGTVQAVLAGTATLAAVAGRYPQPSAIGDRARYRDQTFGDVGGIAYDATARRIYLTETSTNRLDVVSLVAPDDPTTWTIEPLANASGTAGFADGAATTALFRRPTGLYLDEAARQLYVADTGNHVVRVIDLTAGIGSATVRTIAGTPATLGNYGDRGPATAALLHAPAAITRCGTGDVFIADTGNHRIRRIATAGTISTVLGDGSATSSGEGQPATSFPVHRPLGLACDATGNLFVTSTTTIRLLPADASGVVDGSGQVQTIYGGPAAPFPASVTRCLTGLAVIDATTMEVTDSCTGLLVSLHRQPQ